MGKSDDETKKKVASFEGKRAKKHVEMQNFRSFFLCYIIIYDNILLSKDDTSSKKEREYRGPFGGRDEWTSQTSDCRRNPKY